MDWQGKENLIGSVRMMFGDMTITQIIFISVIAKQERTKRNLDNIFDFENRKDLPLSAPIAALYMDKLMSIYPFKPYLKHSH